MFLGILWVPLYLNNLHFLHPEKVNRLLLYAASCGGPPHNSQDVGKFLSILFPQSWIKSHSNNISIPQSKEIVPPDTLKQQFNIAEDWFATNWSDVCGQLSKISVSPLVITGTEDISAPAANSLIIDNKKFPEHGLYRLKELDMV